MRDFYNKFRFEADEGIVFEVSEGGERELIIRAFHRIITANVYSDLYTQPPIPQGFRHVSGEWKSGYVIQRDTDGSQFVWVPVGSLEADGTLNGEDFIEKFGRRLYRDDTFSQKAFHEAPDAELQEQLESVKKYGGFYISRFDISASEDGRPQSVKGGMPWVDVEFDEAKALAASLVVDDNVKSHLPYGAEYDSVLTWLVQSGALSREAVTEDSTAWGNYWNTTDAPRAVVTTGSCEDWLAGGIYDLAGNVDEWTQEQCDKSQYVIRGGNYYYDGFYCPASYRCGMQGFRSFHNTGFRAVLCIR